MKLVPNRTKLRPPSRKGHLIDRPRLLERLGGVQRCRLTVIQAPAGFGKTSLLAQLYERLRADGVRVTWLSLDASDNDYTRLLEYLILALEQLGIPQGARLRETLASGRGSPPIAASATLCNAMAALDEDVVICLDDFHVLTDARIEQLMSHLIQSPNTRTAWVIATRHAPSRLPLGKLRLLNELIELNARDLQFSNTETEEFIRTTVQLELRPELAHALNARAEGWVAGLQMAALSLRDGADPADIIGRFSGTYRNVAEFIEQEVLMRLEQGVGRFLLETSILSRMNVELCNYVTQRSDARRMLDYLESLNLFIFSLDEERNWYRYHHLFSEFLARRLQETKPQRWRCLHARASEWLEENGQPLEAIEHALQAKDFTRAADLLDRLNLFTHGYIGVIERYARRIPESVLEQFPNLQLERIFEWEGEWNFQKARIALARLARVVNGWANNRDTLPRHVDLDYIRAKLAHRELMVHFVADDLAQTERLCQKWFAADYAADSYMYASAAGAQIAAQREHYRCREAAAQAASLASTYQESSYAFGSVFHDSVWGMNCALLGEIDDARRLFEKALKSAVDLHGRLSPLATLPALLLAGVHYEQNRLGEARALIGDYLEIATGLGYVDKLIAGYVTRARIELMESRYGYEAARRTLDEAERCAVHFGFERLRIHVLAERIRQLRICGERDELLLCAKKEQLLGSCNAFTPRAGVTSRQEMLAISWARVAAVQGNVDGAVRLLKSWYRFTLARGCHGATLRLAIELAQLLLQRNDTNAACHYVHAALKLGRGQFVRSFLDGGAGIRETLVRIQARKGAVRPAERQYAEQLLQAFDREESLVQLPEVRSDTTPEHCTESGFSKRELDILELAADDLRNREIAQRLALSENTIKWYWKSIFAKLRVNRRARAVSIARAAGVIF